MLVLQILVSQLYVCVLPCRSFLFGVSWYANTINRSKYQPGCLMGTSHLLRLYISLLPARHSWSSCSILCSCILCATNSHIWQKMQNIQIIYFKMLQLNGHLHDQDKSGVALKVPTNPWPNPSSFLPSVLSYPDNTRIACIREATNCKNPVAAQGRVACRCYSGKRATKEQKEETLLMFPCPHQKAYLHRKTWSLWSVDLWVLGKLRWSKWQDTKQKSCRIVSEGTLPILNLFENMKKSA